jgi:hypothetical protein
MQRASRYSRITNEAIVLQYLEAREPKLRLMYSGIPRHADRQQIEFCILAMVRVSRLLSGRQLLPAHVSISHDRSKGISKFAHFLGKDIEFRSGADEIAFPAGCGEWALTNADPRLTKILLKVCEENLNARKTNMGAFRVMVESQMSARACYRRARHCHTALRFLLARGGMRTSWLPYA